MLRCPDWLQTAEVTAIRNDLTDLLGDGDTGQTVDYHRYNDGASQTVDEDTGVLSDPYTTTSSVPALVGAWSAREVEGDPILQAGDLQALFRKASVSGELSTQDQVTFSSKRYGVVKVSAWRVAPGASDVDLVVVGLRLAGGAGG